MKFTLSPKGPAAEMWERRESKKNWTEVFHLTKSANVDLVSKGSYDLENDWPPALVDLFRFLVANEYEIQELQNKDPNTIPISTRNELAVALGMKQAMTQKLTIIRKYHESTALPAKNERENMADIYRKGQEDIMMSKIQKLDDFLTNYAKENRYSASQYLAEHAELARHLDEYPIPIQVFEYEEGIEETEVIERSELALLIAIIQEYLIRDNPSHDLDQPVGFWARFTRKLRDYPGMPLSEFLETYEDDISTYEGENAEIYENIAEYCNTIEGYIEQEVTKAHVSWAWGVIRLDSIDLGGGNLVLTL
ncbi:hypothetical protein ABW20_dc0109693 [Dactylellina cionopaga]|nr:hypothetical protein ABW20_dc0109693 [Dactylellina cionopaga]